MAQDVLELRPNGTGWLVTLNGRMCGSTRTRDSALGFAANSLRQYFPNAEARETVEFRGLDPAELRPAVPIELHHPLPPGIGFDEAKRRVVEQWLPIAVRRVKTAVAVVDQLCEEYEWGWVICWRPIEPDKGDPRFARGYHFPYLLDRVTGATGLSGGTRGLSIGIIQLLQERPPKLSWPYPPGKQDRLIVRDAFAAAGAFTPISRPSVVVEGHAEPGAAADGGGR